MFMAGADMRKIWSGRHRLAGFALFLIAACASGPAASEGKVLFQSSSATQNFVLHIYEDEHIVLSIDGEAFSFPNSELATPRWAGQTYRAETNGHLLSVDIHTMRSCAVDGVERHRTASVRVWLDGAELRGCGSYTNFLRR
jgi:hypothetical protein